MRILLVEDEYSLSDLIVTRLKKEKYEVDASYDGEEGLYNALNDIYDLIILDIMLPKINGIEILKELKVTGGTLIAVGSSGMAQGISNTSTQYGVLINLNTTYQKDTKVTITDSNGNEIISYTSSKSFQSALVSTPELKNNTAYKVLINNEEYTSFTTSSINTTVGSGMMNGNMMPGGNNQGRRR